MKSIFSIFFIFITFSCFSQQTDTIPIADKLGLTPQKDKKNTLFSDSSRLQSPRHAVYRSAIIPGWGQARNRKWWKVPLVYGGFVSLGLVYEFNQRYYKELLAESQYRKER